MTTPSDPQTPAPGPGFAQPDTAEIPVAAPAAARTTIQQLPPPSAPAHSSPSGASAPSAAAPPQPDPATAPQPTGPVQFVPGPPGAGATPASAQPATSSWPEILEDGETGDGETGDEAARPKEPRAPRDRTALAGAGLVALSLLLLELGLALEFGTDSFWSALPLWSAFATGCVLLGLAAFAGLVPVGRRLDRRTGRRIAAGGLAGLAVFWVLVVLPNADSDRGFLHTAALAALGGAVWLAAGRGDRTTAE